MSVPLSSTASADGSVVVLALAGEFDLDGASALRSALLDCCGKVSPGGTLALDLARCEFLDSTALGVVAAALKRLRSDGCAMLVVNAAGPPLRVLRLTGFDRVVPVSEPGDLPALLADLPLQG